MVVVVAVAAEMLVSVVVSAEAAGADLPSAAVVASPLIVAEVGSAAIEAVASAEMGVDVEVTLGEVTEVEVAGVAEVDVAEEHQCLLAWTLQSTSESVQIYDFSTADNLSEPTKLPQLQMLRSPNSRTTRSPIHPPN